MTPTSRAKLGLDLARTRDLAAEMANLPDEGWTVDGDAEEVGES